MKGLSFNKVIFSKDPGGHVVDATENIFNNVNRQIRTTKAGLGIATRPYVLKTRTDIAFHSNDFLQYFGAFDKITPPYYLHNRLLICNYFTRNPRVLRVCFHPSDWIVFGNVEDVRAYFDIPYQQEGEFDWFKTHQKQTTLFKNYLSRYTPEQYILLQFLKHHETITMDNYYGYQSKWLVHSEEILANCFVVLDYKKQIDITFLKYYPNRYYEKHTLVSHRQWKNLWKRYGQKQCGFFWTRYRGLMKGYQIGLMVRTTLIQVLSSLRLKQVAQSILRKNNRS